MSKVNRNLRYEFLPEALEIIETPSSPLGRTVIWSITAILIFGITWACIGRIDEVATARGVVVPVGDVKVIQSQGGGNVQSIKVQNGDEVKKGQLLVELDSSNQQTDLQDLKDELHATRLERDLLRAAVDGSDLRTVTNSYDVSDEIKNDLLRLTESKLSQYHARTEALKLVISQREGALTSEKAELRTVQEMADSMSADDLRYDSIREKLRTQLNLVSEVEASLSQAKSDLTSSQYDNNASLMSVIVEHDKAIGSLEKRISKAENGVGYQSVRSPVDGTITNMTISTVGGVVSPAQVLMEVVPEGTPLVIEAALPNKDVGYVSPGQKVSIKFDTFSFQKYGMVEGSVKSVGANAVEDKDQGSSYPIVVSFKDKKMVVNGKKVNILPGMTVASEVKTKNKRIIDFFLDPLIKNLDESLKVR